MNDRVHIQYTISLDELPSEVERLIEKADSIMKGSQCEAYERLMRRQAGAVMSLATVKTIHEAKESLTAQLHTLGDIENIVNGYIEYEMQSNHQKQFQQNDTPESNRAAAPSNSMAPLEDLASQIEAFKDQIEDREESNSTTPQTL
tara:strand:+ start:2895 stop:3332 length:438 start_codon:yes stop_codon:yes gene_type:complete